MSEIIGLDDVEQARDRAVGVLRDGGIVVVPTDTVYAVVADAFQAVATRRIFGARRSGRVPLPVVIRSPRQVNGLVEDVSEPAERLMASYWPGSLSLVFAASSGLGWDLGNVGGTVTLRLPAEDFLLGVIAEIGPLACTAASRKGEAAPHRVEDAQAQLGGGVGLYVDGGERDGAASTIVDVTGADAVVLREGAVPADHVMQVATGAVGWGARPEQEAS